jgi:hypothetical protein
VNAGYRRRVDGRYELADDVGAKAVAPRQERDLEVERRKPVFEAEAKVIERAVLEAVRPPHLHRGFSATEKEDAPVQQVRAQVGEHSKALVAPARVSHVSSGSVAVGEAGQVDRTELPTVEQLLEAEDVRLETMVVRGVAGGAVRHGQLAEPGQRLVLVREHRLFHQDVLAVRHEILEQRRLLAIRHADEG